MRCVLFWHAPNMACNSSCGKEWLESDLQEDGVESQSQRIICWSPWSLSCAFDVMNENYDMQDLLNLTANARAGRLAIQSGNPPAVFIRDVEEVVDGPPVSLNNATEMLRRLATPEQMHELDYCGDIRFVTLAEPLGRLRVTARLEHHVLMFDLQPMD